MSGVLESLPPLQREAGIFQATAFLTGAPEIAKKRIGQIVHSICEEGMAALADRQPMMFVQSRR
jgi:hypothetical protein